MDNSWQPYNLETYSGGVSSAVSPDLLPPNQTAWGMNVDFRGTKVHTRPNIHQRMYLPSGLVQGVGYFNLQGGMLVAMIDGFPYRIRIGIRNSDFSFEPIVSHSFGLPSRITSSLVSPSNPDMPFRRRMSSMRNRYKV